jgi:hypothetical protein
MRLWPGTVHILGANPDPIDGFVLQNATALHAAIDERTILLTRRK